MIFTFWEGPMPAYIKLCMKTWDVQHVEYVTLDYSSLHNYTDLDISKLSRFSLPQVADIIRVHVLRDNGGYWLDTDTIMLTDRLPDAHMMGVPEKRGGSIGFLHTEKNSDMFVEWAKYQDEIVDNLETDLSWDIVGNAFADQYTKIHSDIIIEDISKHWPETYMVPYNIPRKDKYQTFYFDQLHCLSHIQDCEMLMLHNSWTPTWYKNLSESEVLKLRCTMSNILREILS